MTVSRPTGRILGSGSTSRRTAAPTPPSIAASSLAAGDLIFILNSDDVFDPRRIGDLAARLKKNPGAALAASWIEIIDRDDARIGIKEAWRTLPPWPAPTAGPFLSDLGDPRLALLETNWVSTTSNIALPATLVRRARSALRTAALCPRLGLHPLGVSPRDLWNWSREPLLRYRVHGANTIGEGADEGRGLMRFEILWVVARHAMRLIRSSAGSDAEFAHLRGLLSTSAPTFGCDAIFDQLLLLRGADEATPPAYEALLDPRHPYTRAAIELLQSRILNF